MSDTNPHASVAAKTAPLFDLQTSLQSLALSSVQVRAYVEELKQIVKTGGTFTSLADMRNPSDNSNRHRFRLLQDLSKISQTWRVSHLLIKHRAHTRCLR